jgi:peptidoglycan hydrolase-like protein with peptidoglycan-binding domain
VNKASSLALLAGAIAAAAAITPVAWRPGPEPAQHLSRVVMPPVVVEASVGKPIERAEPPAAPQPAPETTTVLLPSRSIREAVKVSSQPYKDGEPLRLVRDLQRELKRVGCYANEIDGEWTPGTRRAMQDFTDRVNAALPIERPDPTQLVLLQRHPEIVCREKCRVGDSLADTRCLPSSYVASESKKAAATTPSLQIIWTKSYVTPAAPEPDATEAALPAELAPRADPAPRPRRHTGRPGGVGSLLFGIFSW